MNGSEMSRTDKATKDTMLPRYQVQERQESNPTVPKTDRPKELKNNFKPFFYTKDSQPCQCSACVGAMATIITSTFHHNLVKSATAPAPGALQCSLKAHLGVDKHQTSMNSVEKDTLKSSHQNCSLNATTTSHTCTSPLSKEGLWQNWMSTSGSAQLENESQVANSNHHYHHHNCCHCGENTHGEGERMKVCSYHEGGEAPSGSCSSTPRVCSHHHGSSSCIANEGEGKESSSLAPANGTNSASGEVPRRYCPCCYCELFGHNVPPTAPTSHNYTKRRDIMRQKLEEKKKKRKEDKSERPNFGKDGEQQTSVEELLAFIEGDGEDGEQSKLSKRQKKKLKKQVLGNGDCLFHHDHNGLVQDGDLCDQEELKENSSVHRSEVQDKRKKHSHSVLEQLQSANKSKTTSESTDVDEYDDELEEFKKFCFADAPTGPRKKIPITLNMHDIMSKLSN